VQIRDAKTQAASSYPLSLTQFFLLSNSQPQITFTWM
jgi:hypothetical protein